ITLFTKKDSVYDFKDESENDFNHTLMFGEKKVITWRSKSVEKSDSLRFLNDITFYDDFESVNYQMENFEIEEIIKYAKKDRMVFYYTKNNNRDTIFYKKSPTFKIYVVNMYTPWDTNSIFYEKFRKNICPQLSQPYWSYLTTKDFKE
ncbi:MAG: hypothetical protein KA327_00425, partial [Pseudarcicella sp.]|nr:hypothetical protein [Pseudarcicella sp.]